MNAQPIALGALSVVIVTLPFAHTIALRNIALAIALIATIFAWRSLRIPRPPLVWFFVGLAVIGGLSLVWSVDPAYSRRELKSELLYPPIVFMLAIAWSRDRRALAWLGIAAGVAIVASAGGPFMAWYDWSTGRPGREVFYNGAGFYSTWLVIVYPFALAAALARELPPKWRMVAGTVALIALAAGYLTFNRTFPYVAALQTGLVLGYDLLRARGSNWQPRLLFAAAAVAILVFGLLLVQQERHKALPKDVQETATMARDVRWTAWRDALDRIGADPLRGAGFGRGILRRELQNRYPDTFLWHAHNTVINWGLQMSVPGIALLLALFGGAVWRLGRDYRAADEDLRPYLFAAIVMVLGVFLKNQTDDFFVRQTVLAFWIALGAVLGVTARTARDAKAAS